jgi:hypothetical protein
MEGRCKRHPAGQADGSGNLSCPMRYLVEHLHMSGAIGYLTGQAIVAADRAFPAAVAELVGRQCITAYAATENLVLA